jgi:mRNA interferase RelE/StbE
MYRLVVEPGVIKSLDKLPPKFFRQIVLKILALQFDPRPNDSKRIAAAFRVDSGEYRILYFINDQDKEIQVVLVAKRNDDDVYRQFIRRFG